MARQRWSLGNSNPAQAMNLNITLVVSDLTGCAADLVNENTGRIFQTGNINELAGFNKLNFRKKN